MSRDYQPIIEEYVKRLLKGECPQNITPLPPLKTKINWWNSTKRGFLGIILILLWIILFVSAINILAYFIFSWATKGFFNPETLRYSIYLVVGAYFCLILDKSKIYEAMGIKKDLPFITIEQVKKDAKDNN